MSREVFIPIPDRALKALGLRVGDEVEIEIQEIEGHKVLVVRKHSST